jgi:glycosyltransferase involved in cell wall biosynthesis/GT2 family glycosyltransferase
MMKQLTASIIINTYNRASYLRRLLPGLAHLRGVTFEVVVVNGPSTDDTEGLLRAYQGRVKVVPCPTRNLAHSRNLGIAAAAGEIVVFIDDDALPGDDEWLERFVRCFEQDATGKLAAVGGPVWHRDTAENEFNGGATSDYAFQIFGSASDAAQAEPAQRWYTRVPGGNSAFRRSALVDIGGFDRTYAYYLEEADVCLRLIEAGYTVEHLPGNGIRHYPAPSERRTSKYDRNWRVIARSDTYFALKNGGDPLPRRLVRTLRAAPRKHFVREINSYRRSREIGRRKWLRLLREWGRGVGDGLKTALLQGRATDNLPPPPPFLPFTSEKGAGLRIALLTQAIPGQPGYGGIGRYTFDLAQGLHERGHEVHIICKDERPLHHHSLGFFIHGISAAEAAPRPLLPDQPLVNKNVSYGLAVLDRLAALHRRGVEFDVVHSSNWDCEAASLIRAGVYPTALMLVSPLAQVIVTERWETDGDLRAAVALDRWQIEHADTVCIPSEGVLGSYRSLMGLNPNALTRLRKVSLGIVPDVAAASTSPAAAPRHRLLFVGRCERRKGVHTLMDALPKLLKSFPDWECHFVGADEVPLVEGGTLKGGFLQQHRGAPWLERVVFHGSVSEEALREHYQRCDLFVAPSLFESFGLIYHEAMQYGKAVVGCRTGGVPEVVEHGVEGLLVDPDSAEQLGAALAQLMGDAALRHKMGDAGARRVHQVTNYRTMAAAMEQVYQDTIAAVGEQRRLRRQRNWPRDLPIFAPANALHLEGSWLPREAMPGELALVGEPGAAIRFEAQGDTLLSVSLLRHEWSGVLEVRLGDAAPHYIDCYAPELQLAFTTAVPIPGPAGVIVPVALRVLNERNPASMAGEVWLRSVCAPLAPDSGRAANDEPGVETALYRDG